LASRAAPHPKILAAACFYPTDLHSGTLGEGKNADSLARAREICGELAMIWGRQDPHIPADRRAATHRPLSESGGVCTWLEVNAEHAFTRDEGRATIPRPPAWR